MATIPVPMLSAAGWVRSAAEKADALMAHWFESDHSQTLLYPNEVSSCSWIIQEHSGDPMGTMAAIKSQLEKYLGRYYPQVLVETNSPKMFTDPSPQVEISLYVQVIEADGQTYSFGRLLQISNSKLQKVINLNNTGEQPN